MPPAETKRIRVAVPGNGSSKRIACRFRHMPEGHLHAVGRAPVEREGQLKHLDVPADHVEGDVGRRLRVGVFRCRGRQHLDPRGKRDAGHARDGGKQ